MSLKCVFDWILQPVEKQGHALVLIVKRMKSGLCRFLGDLFIFCQKEQQLQLSMKSFPGHRLVENVMVDVFFLKSRNVEFRHRYLWCSQVLENEKSIYSPFLKSRTDTYITSWPLLILIHQQNKTRRKHFIKKMFVLFLTTAWPE